jgi:O-antigen ligase
MSLDVTIYNEAGKALSYDPTSLQKERVIVGEHASNREQSVLAAGLSVLLMFGVLAFGGTDDWAIAILEVGSALLFLFWMWSKISSGALPLRLNHLYLPIIFFGLLVVAQVVFGLSAYVHVTRVELWKYAAYGSLFVLANNCQEIAARRLLTVLAICGLIVALFALVQYLTYHGKIYWIWQALPSSFGSYVDHSHYAGLMEMLTPIPFAMALTHGVRQHQQMLWTIGGMVMAATIFLSGSRGGMAAFAVQIVFFAGLLVSRRSWRTAWPLFAICLAIGAFVFYMDDGRVSKQIDSLRDPHSAVVSRLDVVKDLPKMVRDRPVAGWGLGVFPIVYPQYRSFSTDLVVNQAHNDYLQALVETGILGFIFVLWFIVNLYRDGIRNFRVNSRLATTRALACLVGCTGILVHSLSDFNLHIPANAAMFFVLCGIATKRQDKMRVDRNPQEWFPHHDPAVVSAL